MWCWRKVKRLLPARKKAASACQMSCFCMSNELLLHVKRVASACQKEGFEIEKAMGLKDKGSRKRPRGGARPGRKRGFFFFIF